MHVSLRSPVIRLLVAAVCLTAAAAYIVAASREYLAYRHAEHLQDVSSLGRAVALSPWNAGYWWRLGTYEYFAAQDAPAALKAFQRATALNPYSARSWLSIALVHQFTGDLQEQRKAIEQASLMDPRTPEVAWEAANFYLLQNNLPLAFRNFRVVLENDREHAPLAITLCWRATGDAQTVIDNTFPPIADRFVEFLQQAIAKNDLQAAGTIWSNLMARKLEFPPALAFPYLHSLINAKEADGAYQAWVQLVQSSPQLASYRPSGRNLIVNGGFEQKMLNGGFDWTVNPTGVSITADTSVFNSGNRSLAIRFDGDQADTGLFQYVKVEPNSEYDFTASIRTDLLGAPGPRFVIADAYEGTKFAEQDDFIGMTPWRVTRTTFTTGPATRLVIVKFERPQPGPVRGTVWIDDVSLEKK